MRIGSTLQKYIKINLRPLKLLKWCRLYRFFLKYCSSFIIEEEINAMKQALDKYGIAMPAFGKIGGLLAGEVLCTL